jgi:UDP-glucuronate decarboxylase
LQDDHEVICLDNFFTGCRQNIVELLDDSKFEVIRHDITESILLEVDQVFHLACPASPVHYQYNPVKTIKTNVMGTINMLGLAKRVRARMLLASTSEVYGNPHQHPQTEDYWGNVNPIGIRSCYDEGKRVAETLTMDYHRQNGVEARIVRIFNTYGPRMLFDDGRVVSNFIVQALQNNPITVYGDGQQTRSFCYVSDLVRGFRAMMDQDDFVGPVNLGNPNEITVTQLAEQVIKMTSSKSELVYEPLPQDDPTRRRPDISLAKSKLGWSPEVDLESGLEATIEDFQKRLNAA